MLCNKEILVYLLNLSTIYSNGPECIKKVLKSHIYKI